MPRLFALIILFASTGAMASVADEALRLKKCYSLFVREVVPENYQLMNDVKAGRINGTDACMRLFDQGSLGANNEVKKNTDGTYDQTAMKILKTFNNLHQTFFDMTDYTGLLMSSSEFATLDIIDYNESSYHLTYALLKPNEPYHKVVTRDSTFKGVRYSRKSARSRRVYDFGGFDFKVSDVQIGGATIVPWSPSYLAETGLLVGIKTPEYNPAPTMPGLNTEYSGANMLEHFGAGVIGSQGYLMASTQHIFGEILRFSDGGLTVNRRWSKRVFNDLLCRQVPVLRSTDIVKDVNMQSNLSFRKGFSCMGCHSTMDPMAASLRNIATTATTGADQAYAASVRFFVQRSPDMGPMDYPVLNGNPNFHRSPATATLKYRTYDGKLVDRNVNDLQELGEAIADENDLYVCAAKRYYEFLTGITHTLNDPGDFSTPKLSEGDALVRKKVIDLGLELRQHQNLRELLRSIIQSHTFIYPAQGV
jgi:hypothetical protein